MNPYYPNLFTPFRIGPLLLRNRLVSSPTSQADTAVDGSMEQHTIAYYGRKAKGGAALVTVGDCIVDKETGMNHPTQYLLDTDRTLPSFVRCAEAIHRHGSIASVELSHGGICCDPAFIGGKRPIGPSETPVKIGFQTEHTTETRSVAMTYEMMSDLAKKFGEAAQRAKRAGFDMCMVHGAHGWLLNQFLSPNINLRTDEFGGSVENRCRFPIMVCKAIREAAGPDFPIEYRINGSDLIPDGLTQEDAVEACLILEPYVDAFHVSAGVHYDRIATMFTHAMLFDPREFLLQYAEAVKKAVKAPVTTVGGHAHLSDMEKVISSGKADAIAMARQLVCDPDTPNKGRRGQEKMVRICLRCGWCQASRFTLSTARCMLNPEIGQEYKLEYLTPAPIKRRVLIAGGGPAGMQAAITSAQLGHKVVLCEKSGSLGGSLRFAKHVPFKRDLYSLTQSMTAEMAHYGVEVRLNTEVTPEFAAKEQPDVLIAALGNRPNIPAIPGVEKPIVTLSSEVGTGESLGGRIVVIGGGLVGCEEAIHIAQQKQHDREVTIVEMLDVPAGDCNFRYRWAIEQQFEKLGVKILLNTRCTAVTDDGVLVTDGYGNESKISADSVVLAAGALPLRDEAEAMRYCAPEFIPIGDCVSPGQVTQAIRGGHDAALSIQ